MDNAVRDTSDAIWNLKVVFAALARRAVFKAVLTSALSLARASKKAVLSVLRLWSSGKRRRRVWVGILT